MQPQKSFVIGDVIKEAYEIVKNHYKLLLSATFVFSTIPSILRIPDASISFSFVGLVCSILALVIIIFTAPGITSMAIALKDGRTPELSEIIAKPEVIGRYFLTAFISFIFVLGGFILLIVPGIILAFRYILSPYIVIDKGISGMAALKESKRLTMGIKGQIFILCIVIGLIQMVAGIGTAIANGIILSILGSVIHIPFVTTSIIGTLVALPFQTVSSSIAILSLVIVYRKILASDTSAVPSTEAMPVEAKVIA